MITFKLTEKLEIQFFKNGEPTKAPFKLIAKEELKGLSSKGVEDYKMLKMLYADQYINAMSDANEEMVHPYILRDVNLLEWYKIELEEFAEEEEIKTHNNLCEEMGYNHLKVEEDS